MGATLTAVQPALKEHYLNSTIEQVFYKTSKDVNPLMAAMEAVKDTGEGFGRQLVVRFTYGSGTSAGADYTKVLAKAQGSTVGSSAIHDRWTVNPIVMDAVASWERDAMDAALGRSAGEAFKVSTVEMDAKIEFLRRQIALYAFGNGYGSLAVIGDTVSSSGFTVGTDVVNRFVEGMDISAATTETGATLNSDEALLVTGTDPETGMVYTSTDPTDSSGGRTPWATGYYVFHQLDRQAAAITAYSAVDLPWGMDAWLPGATVTDSAPFNGITRDGNHKLAGLTFNASGLEPENAFLGALRMLFTQGMTKADAIICNAEDYDGFIAGKDKSKTVQISLGKYELGFDGFNVHSLAGTVPVIPDAMCPSGTFYAGPFKNKKLAPRLVYVNDLVQIDDKDGLMFRKNGRSYEADLYFRGNIVVVAPGSFIRGYNLSV
jgi:hypothetical protein